MKKFAVKIIIFIALLLCVPINSQASVRTEEDFILMVEKPSHLTAEHYLEFVSEEAYTVKPGDTLWGIADSYWGNGAYYRQILSDNKDVVSEPRLLLPGTELEIRRSLYNQAGIEDWGNYERSADGLLLGAEAFEMDKYSPPYQIFVGVPYVNDLQEADPYENWEEFQCEVRACSEEVCGELVSNLSFERYLVTGIGSLCSYSFSFDAGDTEYLIVACFCYNSTTKSEAFAVCEKDCTEQRFDVIKGRVFYEAIQYIDPGVYYAKLQDYIGADDWKYPQLRNPFADAMHSLYAGPLSQTEDYPNDYVIKWKEPMFEELVREVLAELWQLTSREKQAFMEREMTAADLSRIEKLEIFYDFENSETERRLCVRMNGCEGKTIWKAKTVEKDSGMSEMLMSLVDLENFHELKSLQLWLDDSNITDLSPIGALVNLRELTCYIYSADLRVETIDFLGSLVNLRELVLGEYSTQFFENIESLSVLRNCPHLTYLTLYMSNVKSYDFLRSLPEIYYFKLESGGHDLNTVPMSDEALLRNACFVEINGENVRFEVGDGYDKGTEVRG